MSRAVVFEEYGPPEVLHLVNAEVPEPLPGQTVVRMVAAGVQPVDALLRSGRMHAVAAAVFPQRLGNELSGTVSRSGPGGEWPVGAEVIGWAEKACYAEHVVVEAANLVRKPASMPWAEAGALSASGQTAVSAMDALGIGPEDVLLVHAAAGGVGSMLVQLAVAAGAAVIGTASADNHDYLRSLGAVPVSYGDGLVDRLRAVAPGGVTAAVVATGSREALEVSLATCVDPARVTTLVSSPAATELGVPRLSARRSTERLESLLRLWDKGLLRVTVSGSYGLDEAVQAHRRLEGGHVRGKLVVTG